MTEAEHDIGLKLGQLVFREQLEDDNRHIYEHSIVARIDTSYQELAHDFVAYTQTRVPCIYLE